MLGGAVQRARAWPERHAFAHTLLRRGDASAKAPLRFMRRPHCLMPPPTFGFFLSRCFNAGELPAKYKATDTFSRRVFLRDYAPSRQDISLLLAASRTYGFSRASIRLFLPWRHARNTARLGERLLRYFHSYTDGDDFLARAALFQELMGLAKHWRKYRLSFMAFISARPARALQRADVAG